MCPFDRGIQSESTNKAGEVNPPNWAARYDPASSASRGDIGKGSRRARQCLVKFVNAKTEDRKVSTRT